MPDIKDVAREAGVSISTVSNVLNNVDVVTEKTRAKVLRAVEKLNYVPNLNGKFLKSSMTNFIGLFIATIEGEFHQKLVSGMNYACRNNGYSLAIYINEADNVDDAFKVMLGKKVDGAVIVNHAVKQAHIEPLTASGLPVVFADREIRCKTISSFIADGEQGAIQATEHLIDRGARNILFMHGIGYDSQTRYDGYVATLKKHKLPVPDCHLEGDFEKAAARGCIKELLKKNCPLPDAFFAANDEMAIGIIEELHLNGIRVPNDILVAGFDNSTLGSHYFTPSVSSIQFSVYDLGVMAVENIIRMMNGELDYGLIKKLPTELIVRESTTKIDINHKRT